MNLMAEPDSRPRWDLNLNLAPSLVPRGSCLGSLLFFHLT